MNKEKKKKWMQSTHKSLKGGKQMESLRHKLEHKRSVRDTEEDCGEYVTQCNLVEPWKSFGRGVSRPGEPERAMRWPS